MQHQIAFFLVVSTLVGCRVRQNVNSQASAEAQSVQDGFFGVGGTREQPQYVCWQECKDFQCTLKGIADAENVLNQKGGDAFLSHIISEIRDPLDVNGSIVNSSSENLVDLTKFKKMFSHQDNIERTCTGLIAEERNGLGLLQVANSGWPHEMHIRNLSSHTLYAYARGYNRLLNGESTWTSGGRYWTIAPNGYYPLLYENGSNYRWSAYSYIVQNAAGTVVQSGDQIFTSYYPNHQYTIEIDGSGTTSTGCGNYCSAVCAGRASLANSTSVCLRSYGITPPSCVCDSNTATNISSSLNPRKYVAVGYKANDGIAEVFYGSTESSVRAAAQNCNGRGTCSLSYIVTNGRCVYISLSGGGGWGEATGDYRNIALEDSINQCLIYTSSANCRNNAVGGCAEN